MSAGATRGARTRPRRDQRARWSSALRRRRGSRRCARAEGLVLDQARRLGGRELGLGAASSRRSDRGSRRLRLGEESGGAAERRDEDRRGAKDLGASCSTPRRPHPHPRAEAARDGGPRRGRARPEQHELPAALLLELLHECAEERPLALPPLEHDTLLLPGGREQVRVDPLRDELVSAGEARRGGVGDLRSRGEERIDAGEEPLALGASRRIGETLRREERRRRERARVAEREVRQTRQRRLEAVHDVEAPARKRKREARANADRHSHPAPPRDRHRRPERHELPK